MHLQDEQIQRLLHGELEPAAEASGRAHLIDCSECRSQVEEAEREERWILEHLRRLDHPSPGVDVEDLAARARHPHLDYRWVAGVVLALSAAGVAYAVPGSPLPAMVERVTGWIGVSPRPRPPLETPPAGSENAGIAVAPGERFTLVLESGEGGALATVDLTDGSDIVARSLNGEASFTTRVDGLTITTRRAGARLAIELPRAASWVEIRSDGETLLLKDGERIVTSAPMDGEGRWTIGFNKQ
jgi:anti-sigma factor RsiW